MNTFHNNFTDMLEIIEDEGDWNFVFHVDPRKSVQLFPV